MIRLFDKEKDYTMVCNWWEGHGVAKLPDGILPKLGVVWDDDGVDIAAAWLYMDNSVGVCILAWPVSNPEAPSKAVYRAMKHLVAFLGERASEMDYGVMLAQTSSTGLVKAFNRFGFHMSDEGAVQMFKVLEVS